MMWKEKQGKKINLVNEAALSDTSLSHYDMQHIVTTSQHHTSLLVEQKPFQKGNGLV